MEIDWLQQHSFPQNLHDVNVHTITEHIVLFVKKNLILNWQVNVRMYHQLDRRGNKKMQASQDIKTFCEGKTDPLSLEVSSKIQYAKCPQAEEAKYHRDCMQRLLSGRSVGESNFDRRNFLEAKNTLKDFVNSTKQQPMNHLQLQSLMYRNG